MNYFSETTDFYLAGPTALTLGKFDGVHLGHQKLMRRINAYRDGKPGTASAVFSINPGNEPRILTTDEQKDVIEDLGMDVFIRCPFVPEISRMSPEQFVREILIQRLHAVFIAVGTDFRFAYRRQGDAGFLKENEKRFGFQVEVIEKETYQGREISSSYIREALREGDVALAGTLMGRPYSIEGTVTHGRHLGTRIGMPTANIIPEPDKVLPLYGVYVSGTFLDGKAYAGVTNVGVKPTVDGSFAGAETYLFDFGKENRFGSHANDLYGKKIRVELAAHLRPERKFASLEELKAQIR